MFVSILLLHAILVAGQICCWKMGLTARNISWQVRQEGSMLRLEVLIWFMFFVYLSRNGVLLPMVLLIGGAGLVRRSGQWGEKTTNDDDTKIAANGEHGSGTA
jgi:hypothetical protein